MKLPIKFHRRPLSRASTTLAVCKQTIQSDGKLKAQNDDESGVAILLFVYESESYVLLGKYSLHVAVSAFTYAPRRGPKFHTCKQNSDGTGHFCPLIHGQRGQEPWKKSSLVIKAN